MRCSLRPTLSQERTSHVNDFDRFSLDSKNKNGSGKCTPLTIRNPVPFRTSFVKTSYQHPPTPYCVVPSPPASSNRALLAILRSEIDSRAQKRLHDVAAAAAAPSLSRGDGANPPPTLSTSAATAAAAAGAAAVTGGGNTSATAGPLTGTEAEVLRVVDNPGAAQPQARATTAPAPAATGAVPAPVGQSKEVAAATPAAASGGGSAAKPGGDEEKLALENAWNLYLQVDTVECASVCCVRESGSSVCGVHASESRARAAEEDLSVKVPCWRLTSTLLKGTEADSTKTTYPA